MSVVPMEAKRGYQIPRNWSYKQLWANCGSRKPNSGLLQEQAVPVRHLSWPLALIPSAQELPLPLSTLDV